MTNLNFSVLQGCLTKDAQLKTSSGGKTYALFTLVVNEDRKHGEQWTEYANFFTVAYWGSRAEKIAPYLKKGVKVELTGKLEQTRWDDNGDKRSRIDFRPERVYLLSKAKAEPSESAPDDVDDGLSADEAFADEISTFDEDGLY